VSIKYQNSEKEATDKLRVENEEVRVRELRIQG